VQKANTTGFSIEHNQDWEKINTWISPKTNKQLVTKLNTYTRAGRCGSAWVVQEASIIIFDLMSGSSQLI